MRTEPSLRWIILFFAVLLSACAGTQNVKQDYKLDVSSKKGLVVGTLTLKQSAWVAPIFHFKSVNADAAFKAKDDGISGAIAFSDNMITHRPRSDFPDRMAKLFVVELPAGKYVFHEMQFPKGAAAGPIYIDTSGRSTHQVSFEVEEGRVVYAGDLLIDADKSIMQGGVIKGFEARDFLDKDRPQLTKDYPNIDFVNVKKSLYKIRY
jgi:hypothetical protein